MGALSIRLPGRSIGIIPLSFETTWTHSAFESDPFDRPKKIAGLLHPIKKTPLPDNNFSYGPMTPDLRFSPAPLGHRVKKSDSRGITQYLIDNTGNTLAELDDKNAVRRSFLHTINIDDPLSITDEFNHTYFMLPDGLGSVSMLVDREGDPVQVYTYEPFGKPNVTARDKNALKFTARPFDPDAQLQENRARYYDPDQGRWLTKDPLPLMLQTPAFRAANLRNPVALQSYTYGANNPVLSHDPFGLVVVGFSGFLTKADSAGSGIDQISRHPDLKAALARTNNKIGVFRYDQEQEPLQFIFRSLLEEGPIPTIILYGHSYGGDTALKLPLNCLLKDQKIKAVVTLDPQRESKVPSNVLKAVNYFETTDLFLKGLQIVPGDGHNRPNDIVNVDIKDLGLDLGFNAHTDVDNDSTIQQKVVDDIMRALGP